MRSAEEEQVTALVALAPICTVDALCSRSDFSSGALKMMSGRPRHFVQAVALMALGASAAAIPPYPPAQKGSRVSTYVCPGDRLIVTENWDYAASRERQWTISINGRPLSEADRRTVANEIDAFGAIQSNFTVCTRRGPELILIRYTPTAGQLYLSFQNGALIQVARADDSTDHKLNYRAPSK